MRAADDAHVGRKAGRRRDFWLERSQRIPGLAHGREEPPPAELVDHAREIAFMRAPEVGVRAERGRFRSHRSAEAPGEILRVGQERRRLLELSRIAALEIENVPPEIEAARQMGRPRLVIGRARRVIGGVHGGESVKLIVERRQRRAAALHEDAGAAMRRGRDRLDGKSRAEVLERADEERPGALRVELEIGPLGVRSERRVGRRALGENLAAAIEHDDLHVRLADVEDRDAAVHALSPYGTLREQRRALDDRPGDARSGRRRRRPRQAMRGDQERQGAAPPCPSPALSSKRESAFLRSRTW